MERHELYSSKHTHTHTQSMGWHHINASTICVRLSEWRKGFEIRENILALGRKKNFARIFFAFMKRLYGFISSYICFWGQGSIVIKECDFRMNPFLKALNCGIANTKENSRET